VQKNCIHNNNKLQSQRSKKPARVIKKSCWLATYEKPCGKRLRGPSSSGEDIESNFRCRMLRLAQGVAVIRAFEKLAIEHHCGLEARCMVRSFSDASVRWQIEAAPLRKLLKLILVHTCSKQARLHHPLCTPRLTLKSSEVVAYYTLLIHSLSQSLSPSRSPSNSVNSSNAVTQAKPDKQTTSPSQTIQTVKSLEMRKSPRPESMKQELTASALGSKQAAETS